MSSHVDYDPLDRPTLLIAGEGSGREIHQKFSYTSTGLPWQERVRDDIATDHWQVTSSVYDALGRVTKQILPQVKDATTGLDATPQFQTTYGPDGSVQSVGDAYGNVTSILYDVLGNSSQTLGPQVRDVRSGLDTRPASSQRYDAAGRTVAVTDPLSRTWEYRWDAVGRLRASLGPLMNPGEVDEEKRRAVTRYNPSLTGEDEIIDAEGHSTFITYDATGQVRRTRTTVSSTHPTGSPTEEELVETITRDLMGRMQSTEDGEGQLTGFTYDGIGRLTSRTWDPGDPARKKVESVFYDALLRTGRQDAKEQATAYDYDARFLLERVIPANKPAEELEYIRDDLGRLSGVNAPDGVTGMGNADCAYTYDALGRLKSEISNGHTTTYGYDLNGLPRSITNSRNDRELRMSHDAAGRLTRLEDIMPGQLPRTTGFGYDVGGRLLREDLANGLVETSSYDRMGRRTGKQLRTLDWDVVCGSRYTYDLNSNVTSLRETTGPLAVPSRTVTMEYDERGRLLREEQSGAVNRTERHGYDLADNRTWSRKLEGGVETARDYKYGTATNGYNSNQLAGFLEKVGAASPVTTNYLYDANGNRTQRSSGGQLDTYVYDTFDRLVEMTLGTAGGDNGTYRYAYDHASRRIGREVPGGAKRNFAFSGTSPVFEWMPSGTGLTENIGGGVGGRIYSYDSGSPVWDFHDSRGDLLGQTSSGGTLFYRALNDASGRAVVDSGDRSGGYGANSKWEEPGGLVNDGYRYRDLDVGAFINRDPAGFIDGLNVYSYVGHNPWTMFDPLGLDTSSESGYVVKEEVTFGFSLGNLIGDERSERLQRSLGLEGNQWKTGSYTGDMAITLKANARAADKAIIGALESVLRLPEDLATVGQGIVDAATDEGFRKAAPEALEETASAIKAAAGDYLERLANGDLETIGETSFALQSLFIPSAKPGMMPRGSNTLRRVGDEITDSGRAAVPRSADDLANATTKRSESMPGTAPSGTNNAAEATYSLNPGQAMSEYPRGRRVGGRGESPRPFDPPSGFQESGAWDPTPKNIALMEKGRPPTGRDGLPVELHHRDQNPLGPLDEMTSTTHDGVDHPESPSRIDRSKFAGERKRYWRARARILHGQSL